VHILLSTSTLTGWPQSRTKKFSEFFQSHNYTFPEIIATKSIRNNDFQGSFHIKYYSHD